MEEIREFEYRVPRFPADFHFLLRTEPHDLDVANPESTRHGGTNPSASSAAVIHARCHEISESGLAAWVAEPLDVNSRVVLLISFPGTQAPVPIAAIVTRRHGSDHVFSFVLPSTKDREHLRQHLLPMQSSEG